VDEDDGRLGSVKSFATGVAVSVSVLDLQIHHVSFVCHPHLYVMHFSYVIPDLIRDPVVGMHWIAGQARNDN
jgi:hypothetical protein